MLSRFWFPIAEVVEVGAAPFKARLLDVDLVVFRGANGLAVARDRCPHRHVRLSGGQVEDGQIICPYHALAFDETGQCTRIPAVGPDARIPRNYRVETFPVQVRYGLVWTCLVPDPDRDLPVFPDLVDSRPEDVVFIKTRDWPVSSARQVENFFDIGHLPVVHGATLGGKPSDPVAAGKVTHQKDSVTLVAVYVETPFGGAPRPCEYTYRIVLPFAIDFTVRDGTGHDMRLYDIASPTSAHACRVFQFMKDTRHVDEHHRALIEGLDHVNLEDIGILAGMTQDDIPLNARHEIHLQVDNIAHAYRERLRGLGLGGAPVQDRDWALTEARTEPLENV
ncbi:Rieske 2Fe-2S domain-containing protein [Caulobacter sp. AP07]|uniref:Rieske 2Fe-2S domain-containing protein n=1 Tax=Caulobacter sp. AP07 TaxID=1144304 RepID=UPI0003140B75|nr:Rieske 2Fe-2S domain-containing protein [Caulobacter sp. AP07]